jgi:hypothetical protein
MAEQRMLEMLESWPKDSVAATRRSPPARTHVVFVLCVSARPPVCMKLSSVLLRVRARGAGGRVRLGCNHQAWCEVESARDSLKQTTRHEAGLEAMGELQNAWRRLKRDEKVCVCSQLPIALGLVRARLSPLARAALLQPGGREGALVAAAARAQHALPDGLGVLQAVGKALGKLREQCDHLKVCHGIARVLCAAPCSPC